MPNSPEFVASMTEVRNQERKIASRLGVGVWLPPAVGTRYVWRPLVSDDALVSHPVLGQRYSCGCGGCSGGVVPCLLVSGLFLRPCAELVCRRSTGSHARVLPAPVRPSSFCGCQSRCGQVPILPPGIAEALSRRSSGPAQCSKAWRRCCLGSHRSCRCGRTVRARVAVSRHT